MTAPVNDGVSHETRIGDASDQLLRYGDVADERLLDVLDALTDINDDMHHARHKDIVSEACKKAVELLHEIARSYEG